MADLILKKNLLLQGNLKLVADGGKVMIGTNAVLVEGTAPTNGAQGSAVAPVIQPPPPPPPLDDGLDVFVVSSFNKMITANDRNIVALGIVMQGNTPTWPGMMLPSSKNSEVVMVAGVAANVSGDQATIFPSGGTATIDQDGQES